MFSLQYNLSRLSWHPKDPLKYDKLPSLTLCIRVQDPNKCMPLKRHYLKHISSPSSPSSGTIPPSGPKWLVMVLIATLFAACPLAAFHSAWVASSSFLINLHSVKPPSFEFSGSLSF